MSTPNDDSQNPYQAPASAAPPPGEPLTANNVLQVKLLKDFRSQIHALGGFWIFIGALAGAVGIFLASAAVNDLEDVEGLVVLGLILVMSLAWIGLGICTCLKQMWAVYVGLVLSYLSLIGNIINFRICGLVILGIVIVQAHRVISWAGHLKQAGIPLTARPEQLQVKFRPPDGPFQWPTG